MRKIFLFQANIALHLKEKDTKFNVSQVKELYSSSPYLITASAFDIEIEMDDLKILQSILSKQLPPERYNGILNLFYIFLDRNATSEEIENTLVMSHIHFIPLYIIRMHLQIS